MTFKIPDSDKDLDFMPSQDDLPQLIKMYNKLYRTINGKTVSDIALVFHKIQEFQTIERIDLIIPYTFGHVRREPKGHRIWYLSQPDRKSKYYNGNYFNIEKAQKTKRNMRKKCRLSDSAIELFNTYPEIKRNERISICA